MFVPWDAAAESLPTLQQRIAERAASVSRRRTRSITGRSPMPDSPRLRDSNPSVVVIPSLGVFGFAKDKREARITTEFFVNAIHVMDGATVLEDADSQPTAVPQARRPEQAKEFTSFHNYVALPRLEAFRIEYWALEEAKLQRLPPEREFSRRIVLVVGGGSGIGRDVCSGDGQAWRACDCRRPAISRQPRRRRPRRCAVSSAEMVMACALDLVVARVDSRRAAVPSRCDLAVSTCVVNTAAIYPTPDSSTPAEAVWSQALTINVTSNHVLALEAAVIFKTQNLPASIVLTSSANAVVPEAGQRAVRREQGRDQSSDSRAGGGAWART